MGVVALLVLMLGALFAYAVLGPVLRMNRRATRPPQYYLSDLFWLLLLLQLPFAFLGGAYQWYSTARATICGGLMSLVVVYAWCRAVSFLSRLGIDAAIRRGVFIVVILPVAVLGSIAAGPLIIAAFSCWATPGSDVPYGVQVWISISVGILPVAAYLFRWLTRWVLAGAAAPTSNEDPGIPIDDKAD
jgi:hypothetical protein